MLVNFAPNQEISCVQIDNIIDDSIQELVESFFLVITQPPRGSRIIPGGNATVTIDDNDVIIQSTGE